MSSSAYDPLRPARRPGEAPGEKPLYRVLIHKRFIPHYAELVRRAGLQQAQQMWDHLAMRPGEKSGIASTTVLKGRSGRPQGPGWSKTIHYEVTGDARIDYQYNDEYRTHPDGDSHRVVAILTISYGSH